MVSSPSTLVTELELQVSEVRRTLTDHCRVVRTWPTSKHDVLNRCIIYVSLLGEKLVHEVCGYVIYAGPAHYATWLGGLDAI